MHPKLGWRRGAIALLFVLLISCNSLVNTSPNLTVSAAASLQKVMTEIQQIYTRKQANAKIVYNFGASGSLQQQIEQGANIDIFISAASQQMDALEAKGLILTDTRKNLLTNQIVLIVPNNSMKINSFPDLASDRFDKIAIGEPNSVPVGKYAQQVLSYFKVYDKIEKKLIFARDARQILSYVETKNVDAGIVYLTDAKSSNLVNIILTAPTESHSPILYPLAVMKNSKNKDTAKKFAQFLSSQTAIDIYEKYGFNQPAVKAK